MNWNHHHQNNTQRTTNIDGTCNIRSRNFSFNTDFNGIFFDAIVVVVVAVVSFEVV